MPTVFRKIKNFIRDRVAFFDKGPRNIGFKFKDDFEFKSFTGGLITLIVAILLLAFSFNTFIQVAKMKEIITTEKIQTDVQATDVKIPMKKGMMFAIGVRQLDLRTTRVFDFRLTRMQDQFGERGVKKIKLLEEVGLVPCTLKDWADAGLSNYYDNYQIYTMLCINQTEVLRMTTNRGYRFEIQKCAPQSTSVPQNLNQYLNEQYQNATKYSKDWESFYAQQFNYNYWDNYDSNRYYYDIPDNYSKNLPPVPFNGSYNRNGYNYGSFTNQTTPYDHFTKQASPSASSKNQTYPSPYDSSMNSTSPPLSPPSYEYQTSPYGSRVGLKRDSSSDKVLGSPPQKDPKKVSNENQPTQKVKDTTKVSSNTPQLYKDLPCFFEAFKSAFGLPKQYHLQIVHVDSLINAKEPEYLKHFVDQRQFAIEISNSSILRHKADIQVASYEITTNTNIFVDYELERLLERKSGLIVPDNPRQSVFLYQQNILSEDTQQAQLNNFLTVDIRRSPDRFIYKRRYKTFWEAIGDIGGRFTVVFFFVGLILGAYNSLNYSLSLSSKLYYDSNKKPIEAKKVNPLRAIGYFFYWLGKKICTCFTKKPQEEENNSQASDLKQSKKSFFDFPKTWYGVMQHSEIVLDIEAILKKIQHLERACVLILGQKKFEALYFQTPYTVDEQQKMHKLSQMHRIIAKRLIPTQNEKQSDEYIRTLKSLFKSDEQIRSRVQIQNKQKTLPNPLSSISLMNPQINLDDVQNQTLPNLPSSVRIIIHQDNMNDRPNQTLPNFSNVPSPSMIELEGNNDLSQQNHPDPKIHEEEIRQLEESLEFLAATIKYLKNQTDPISKVILKEKIDPNMKEKAEFYGINKLAERYYKKHPQQKEDLKSSRQSRA